jgi:hypothetical protein
LARALLAVDRSINLKRSKMKKIEIQEGISYREQPYEIKEKLWDQYLQSDYPYFPEFLKKEYNLNND